MTLAARATVTNGFEVATLGIRITFSDARCSSCNRKLMAIPGTPTIEVRSVKNDDARSGRGRVVGCPRCKTLNEVIEHVR